MYVNDIAIKQDILEDNKFTAGPEIFFSKFMYFSFKQPSSFSP